MTLGEDDRKEKMDAEEHLTPPVTDFEESVCGSVFALTVIGESASHLVTQSHRSDRKGRGANDVVHANEVGVLFTEDVKMEGLVALGSFGALYQGTCAGGKVAVKQLRNKWIDNKHAQEDFRKEIIMMSKLTHPHIVLFVGSVYDRGGDVPRLVVLEWIDGGNLYDAIHKKKRSIMTSMKSESDSSTPDPDEIQGLQPSELFHFMNDIALGMEYLHSHTPCIIHRDLKPQNLLLSNPGDGWVPRTARFSSEHGSGRSSRGSKEGGGSSASVGGGGGETGAAAGGGGEAAGERGGGATGCEGTAWVGAETSEVGGGGGGGGISNNTVDEEAGLFNPASSSTEIVGWPRPIIKITDFGLSRFNSAGGDGGVASMTGNTGSLRWMAPEMISCQKYNEKVDVYSFGTVVWEMFTGEVPYKSLNAVQVALAVTRGKQPIIPDECPPDIKSLISKCWAMHHATRPSFDEIVKECAVIRNTFLSTRETPPPVFDPNPSSRVISPSEENKDKDGDGDDQPAKQSCGCVVS